MQIKLFGFEVLKREKVLLPEKEATRIVLVKSPTGVEVLSDVIEPSNTSSLPQFT